MLTDASGPRALPPLQVVILAGGVGTRFWPASTPGRPKQLLPLGGPDPLIVDAVRRALGVASAEQVRVVAGEPLATTLQGVLPELPHSAFLREPRARGTAPALAWAAMEAFREDPSTVLVSLHSDHRIAPESALVELLRGGVEVARTTRSLVTVGMPPSRPETGYGYLLPGTLLPSVEGGVPARSVVRFVEKPDAPTALRLIAEGYRWNSGIFIWRADAFLEELRAHSPEIAPHLARLEAGDTAGFFDAVPSIAIDHALLERSAKVLTIEAELEWDDVGSWEALARTWPADAQGNVGVGPVHAVDCTDTLAWAEGGDLVLWGVEGLVAVRSGKVTVVFPRERAPHLKELLAQLPPELLEG
jgi:mannose-1-phosphate guanylyltransferase